MEYIVLIDLTTMALDPPPPPLTSLRLKWNFRKCVLLSGRVPLLKFVFIKMKNMRLKGSVDAKMYYIISWVT